MQKKIMQGRTHLFWGMHIYCFQSNTECVLTKKSYTGQVILTTHSKKINQKINQKRKTLHSISVQHSLVYEKWKVYASLFTPPANKVSSAAYNCLNYKVCS